MEVDQKEEKYPPLFTHDLNESDLKLVNAYVDQFNKEFAQRAELMLKRLDVTVEAFFWSDRVKKMENEIKKVFLSRRQNLRIPPPVTLEDLKNSSAGWLFNYFKVFKIL